MNIFFFPLGTSAKFLQIAASKKRNDRLSKGSSGRNEEFARSYKRSSSSYYIHYTTGWESSVTNFDPICWNLVVVEASPGQPSYDTIGPSEKDSESRHQESLDAISPSLVSCKQFIYSVLNGNNKPFNSKLMINYCQKYYQAAVMY
jgi:hypothetical protein